MQVVRYSWKDGFHPPNVEPEAVNAAIDALKNRTPEGLLAAAEKLDHCLHKDLFGADDAAWARVGRVERCRKIMASIVVDIKVGKKIVETRAYEVVRVNGMRRWEKITDIANDKDLIQALFAEVIRLHEQLLHKMQELKELLK